MAAGAAGVLWGMLPLGYWAARLAGGADPRAVSAHQVGVGSLVRRVGARLAALVTAVDLLKGLAAVLAAWWAAPRPGAVAAAGVGVLLGHLESPYQRLAGGARLRSRGAAVAAGLWLGLAAAGLVSPGAALVPAAVWILVVAAPRLAGGRWGYPSLATVAAAVSAPLGLWAAGRRDAVLAMAAAVAALVAWRHKEHLGRILDGVELRLGDRLPLPGLDDEVACAFLLHPMTPEDWWQSNRWRWLRPLVRRGLVPAALLDRLSLWMRPMKVDEIRGIVTADGVRARVYLLGVPYLPGRIKENEELAVRRATQAAVLAGQLGASVLGLGAYWSVVGGKGLAVQRQSPVAVTNGGAYTAGAVAAAIPRILERLGERGVRPRDATAAVVGANGVVGFGICRMIAGSVGRLLMVGTSADRLERSAERIRRRFPGMEVVTATDLGRLREADVIFSATSQVEPVIFPEHVKEGALIYDVGRPADVHPSVAALPGVEVVPGGVVELPGPVRFRLDLGYGPGLVPACLAESVLIAVDRAYDRCTVGAAALTENIRYFVERGRALGFRVVTKAPWPRRA